MNSDKSKIHWKSWSKLTLPKGLGGIGFRDLTLFNKTLLAKQVWRMFVNQDLLLTKVFKARYFKLTDIINAGIDSNPSYIWRSLMWSNEALRTGTYWKVGNGESINTRHDNWIPELFSGIITSNVSYNSNTSIDTLILPSNCWDVNKINELFLPFEAEAIQKIPIAMSRKQDSRYWKFEKKGVYSVRSGYWRNYLNQSGTYHPEDLGECSTKDQLWTRIWNLKIPPKVKKIVWKAAHDAIATEANLHHHRVTPGALFVVLIYPALCMLLFFVKRYEKYGKV